MAASGASQGYQCEFVDSVHEDFYCKQCSLVARKLTYISCCGESYCNACIQQDKPCPACGTQEFQTLQQVKHQKKILNLRVSCIMKARGCGWCGLLEHLDAHLDPNTGDCEYTDIDCPLNCHNKINKKNISDHLAKECVKRDYVCPHCAYLATYEIVSNIHWPECSYFPLTCPNRCGVTCERTTMEEDHMKICPLQEVECQLKHIGCAERFPRQEEEEHMREKAQTHLLMMAATSVKMSQDFQGKLQEQGKKLQEQERKLQEQEIKSQEQEKKSERKSQEQERKLQEQEEKLQEQRTKIYEQEEKLQEQDRKLHEQGTKLQDQKTHFEKRIENTERRLATDAVELEDLRKRCGLSRSFIMENFSDQNQSKYSKIYPDGHDWHSPHVYTHVPGYKFYIGIDVRGKDVTMKCYATTGDYDDLLQWPVKVAITLELINHFENGRNKLVTLEQSWAYNCRKVLKRRAREYCQQDTSYRQQQDTLYRQQYDRLFGKHKQPSQLDNPQISKSHHLISHTDLPYNGVTQTHFLKNDTLHFKITRINVTYIL